LHHALDKHYFVKIEVLLARHIELRKQHTPTIIHILKVGRQEMVRFAGTYPSDHTRVLRVATSL